MDVRAATCALGRFYDWAATVQIPEVTRLATTIDRWSDEVLAYFRTAGPAPAPSRPSAARSKPSTAHHQEDPMSPAPGWYTDPNSATQERYWDGAAWTGQTRPATTTAAGSRDEGTPASVKGQLSAPARRRTLLLAVSTLVVGTALVGGMALLWPGEEQSPPAGTSRDPDQPRETGEATDDTTPTPELAASFDIAWRTEVACAGGGFVASPVTAFVVTGEDCQDVTAIDLRDGSFRWNVGTRSHEHADEVAATVIHTIDGVVLANRDDPFGVPGEVVPRHLVTAFDEDTGEVLWHRGFASSWSAGPDGVFGSALDGSFQGFDLETGDLRWSYQPGDEERVVRSSVVSSDHVVIIVSRPHEASSPDSPPPSDLVGLRVEDGAENWRRAADRTDGQLLATGGAVLIGPPPSGEAATLALDASSGERLWERAVGPVMQVGEHLFLADGDMRSRLDPRTGAVEWGIEGGAGLLGASDRYLFTTEVDVEFSPPDAASADDTSTIPEGAEAIGGTLRVDGDPVSGVIVEVLRGGEPKGTGVSNAEGAWAVQLPTAGTYEAVLLVDTLPPGVSVRDPDDRPTREVSVQAGQQRTVLFPLRYGEIHRRLVAYELGTGELAWDVDLGVGPHASRLLVDEDGFLLFGFNGTLASWRPTG